MSLAVSSYLVGWSSLLSGFVFIISLVFLTLMFSTKTSPWGPLNDVSYVMALLLIVPALFGFYRALNATRPAAAAIALILSVSGILIISITQIRLVLNHIAFKSNLKQGSFGSGLQGIGFVLFHLVHLQTATIPEGLVWLGLISGALLALGIPTSLFYVDEELEILTGKADWKKVNKMAVVVMSLTFIGQIGLFAWVIWYGMHLISL